MRCMAFDNNKKFNSCKFLGSDRDIHKFKKFVLIYFYV